MKSGAFFPIGIAVGIILLFNEIVLLLLLLDILLLLLLDGTILPLMHANVLLPRGMGVENPFMMLGQVN